jgi:hypothetical protein
VKRALVLGVPRVLLLVAFGCQDVKECGGGTGLDLPGLGVVHECQLESGELELCWRDGNSDELADSLIANGYAVIMCNPTERHLGPCRWTNACQGDGGANAYNGPWCPPEEAP